MKRHLAAAIMTIVLSIFLHTAGAPASQAAETLVDNRIYAQLLGRYVQNGVVDYAGLKGQEAQLDRYLDHLAEIDTGQLSDKERFAFYVNAYYDWSLNGT